MNYQKIYKSTITDGPGVRCAFYVSGCTHHCEGCHNPGGWDFCSGTKYTSETEVEILDALGKDYIRGLSILGGEPYDQRDSEELLTLVRKVKMYYPDKSIWVWTGYEWDQIKSHPLTKYVDVAVTGRFNIHQRDISAANMWRGSRNQRVIDVQASLENGKAVGLDHIPNNEI